MPLDPAIRSTDGPQSNLLRQRCDARRFEPLLIDIIAKRKVALPLNHRELASEQSQGRKEVTTPAWSGAPVCTCNSLFGDLLAQV
jgi:hypothetical protein